MNSKEIHDANQYLKNIEGGNLVSIGRAASMGWFLFDKDNDEYALHLQTSFRVTLDEKILFAGADIFQPSEMIAVSEKFDLETFEWDVQGNNLYDENVKLFMEKYSQNLTVNDVFMNQLGDLSIQLSERVKIDVFVNMSREECWRFFKRHSDNHLVIGGDEQ